MTAGVRTGHTPLPGVTRTAASVAAVACLVTAAALGVVALVVQPSPRPLWLDALSPALFAGAACVLRATVHDRHARTWALIGIGLVCYGAGDLYWAVALQASDNPPIPSWSDAGYLAFYAFVGPAIVLELRRLIHGREAVEAAADGLIVGLAFVAVVAVLVFPHVLAISSGATAEVLTNLAYPVADLALMAILLGALVFFGRRPPRSWMVLIVGIATFLVADAVYLYQAAEGSYETGGLLDAGWAFGSVIMALGAWVPASELEPVSISWRVLWPMGLAGLAATTVVVWDHFHRLLTGGVVIAAVALLAVLVRLLIALRDNQELAEENAYQAETDALTGLPNRRALLEELDTVFASSPPRPCLLAIYDLNLFKRYNDTFGHAAGDGLLQRLGANLAAVADARTHVYRLGGDEFCVLVLDADDLDATSTAARAAIALSERGSAFDVTASWGAASIPSEARSATSALRLADERMYRQKGTRAEGAALQARDVLVRALAERSPELIEHVESIGMLAAAVAQRLGLNEDAVQLAARAAELQDIGKVAIPDSVLQHTAELTEHERGLLRRHPLVGERILSAAPSLREIAAIVRSCQEHFDGTGYPDGLAGDAIPIAARVAAACTAYAAMTGSRPYRASRSPEGAIAELRACAGSQFDPRVVEALCEEAQRPEPEWRGRPGSGVHGPRVPPEVAEALRLPTATG